MTNAFFVDRLSSQPYGNCVRRRFFADDLEEMMSLNAPLLRSSFDLVIDRDPELAKHFYDHLFAIGFSPRIKKWKLMSMLFSRASDYVHLRIVSAGAEQ